MARGEKQLARRWLADLTWLSNRGMNVGTMQVETKFLRLQTPVTLGSFFGDWRVCWLGGWSKHRFYYVVIGVAGLAIRISP